MKHYKGIIYYKEVEPNFYEIYKKGATCLKEIGTFMASNELNIKKALDFRIGMLNSIDKKLHQAEIKRSVNNGRR